MSDGRWTVVSVVGTRPNFMKTAPVLAELSRRPDRFTSLLVHTGQHYDDEMSTVFLEELGIGDPDYLLGVGAGTHVEQITRVMERLEPVLAEIGPDLAIVPGDVNSTLGGALAAAVAGIPVGHIEAGLRSFDPTMPEELNRRLVDQLSQFLFTHSPEARENLLREGCEPDAIHYVGNTMIDTLMAMWPRIDHLDVPATYEVEPRTYVLVTLHRPPIVDTARLIEAVDAVDELAEKYDVLFPVHPRTREALRALGLAPGNPRVRLLEPLGYLDFLGLLADASAVITDSGGIQEEATFLGIPCFTLRANTERPVTVEVGTNTMLGLAPERIAEVPRLLIEGRNRLIHVPPLWDGLAARRLVDVLEEALAARHDVAAQWNRSLRRGV